MNYSNFKIRFYNDVLSIYPNAQLEDNLITITSGHLEISISMSEAYSVLELIGDYSITLKRFLKNINEYKNKHKYKLDYNCIYPSIRPKIFGRDESFPFFRNNYFLDLDILYIQDMGEMFKFLSEQDIANHKTEDIRAKSIDNLGRLLNPLEQLETGMDVYTYKYLSDFNASRVLLDNDVSKVTKVLGESFLIALPSTTTIFYAKDTSFYHDFLNHIIKVDPGEHKISDNIYRYNNGIWTYTDRKYITMAK